MQELRQSGGRFGFGFGLVSHRKIRPTQLWVELSWVVAKIHEFNSVSLGGTKNNIHK